VAQNIEFAWGLGVETALRVQPRCQKTARAPAGRPIDYILHSTSANGMVRPCSCPASDKLARGAKDKEHAMSENLNSAIAVIGIDIGKNSFHVVGLDARGTIVLRQKGSRGQVEVRFSNLPPCVIGMEACVDAHHLSRRLKALGHDARLMPAKYVRPYSKGKRMTSAMQRRSLRQSNAQR
jgi:hypothetical protein